MIVIFPVFAMKTTKIFKNPIKIYSINLILEHILYTPLLGKEGENQTPAKEMPVPSNIFGGFLKIFVHNQLSPV